MEILIILLLSMVNGVFSMAEAALISARRIRLKRLAATGGWSARTAYKLAMDPHRFLPTVQIGITAVSIIAGVYGGTEVAGRLAQSLVTVPWIAEYAEVLGFVITVALTTYLSIVFGELVPKTIGISNPEKTAVILAPVMQVMYFLTAPFIWLLSRSTTFMLKLLRFTKNTKDPPVTEDELKHLIEQGRQSGILEKQESDMLHSIFSTADRHVGSLMTHRNEIIWIDEDATADEVMKMIRETIHTSFPVCHRSLDQVRGIVITKELLVQQTTGQHFQLKQLIRQPLYVPESMPALELLSNFRKSHQHIAFVMNEYGALEGIVTLHDVVEAIFGDIPSSPQVRAESVIRPDGSYLIDGMMPTPKWTDLLNMRDLGEEKIGSYNTLGGFIMHQLGRIPKAGDHFEFHDLIFEVMDMDGKRVDKVLIRKIPEMT